MLKLVYFYISISRYVERTLHMAVEACLDIANHIISYEGYREPVDNKDVFQVLFEQKILDERLMENLKKMAQFRNVIVHDYIRIQPEIVYAILQKNLGDILEFANLVKERFL
ncbi:MAG: type VII toxin-antitoxin system HepT family RNase toxin [Tepidanaerobacteraceae bacterium]